MLTSTDCCKSLFSQNILIIENQLLLGASIESLLTAEHTLNIHGVMPQNEQELLEAVWRYQPDVLILDASSPLTSPIRLLSFLNLYTNLRIITINKNHNWIQIYDQKKLKTTSRSSLAMAIKYRKMF